MFSLCILPHFYSRTQPGSKTAAPTPTGPADWELLFRVHLNSPIMQLAWHGGRGTLACVTEDSTVILNESVMHAYMRGDLSVSVQYFVST